MKRDFEIGDRIICNESGVIGKAIKFYTPTSCSEQTMVLCDDGRKYHAPTNTWSKTTKVGNVTIKLPLIDIYNNIQKDIYRSLGVSSNLIGGR